MTTRQISSLELALLTLATAVVTANGYYIHPIIARIAEDFEVSASSIGLVPALNQLALAVGIFLLLPLGDRFSNRRLISFFVAGQCAGITMMAFAPDVYWFATGSTLLGFFTIAPYLTRLLYHRPLPVAVLRIQTRRPRPAWPRYGHAHHGRSDGHFAGAIRGRRHR
jgi:MFS family permease